MRNLQLLFLILLGNSVLFSMEKEPKNIVTCYRDSNNQSWRVDREIWLPKKNDLDSDSDDHTIYFAFFNKKSTKIRAVVGDYIYTWDRVNGENLDKIYDEEFCSTQSSSDSLEDEFQLTYTSQDNEESIWRNELFKKFIHTDEDESKKIKIVSKFNHSIVYVWDREAKKEVAQLTHESNVQKAFIQDVVTIHTLTKNGFFRIWNGKTGKELFKFIGGENVKSVCVNAAKTEIVIATKDNRIQILVKEISQ